MAGVAPRPGDQPGAGGRQGAGRSPTRQGGRLDARGVGSRRKAREGPLIGEGTIMSARRLLNQFLGAVALGVASVLGLIGSHAEAPSTKSAARRTLRRPVALALPGDGKRLYVANQRS